MPLDYILPVDPETGLLNVVIETPKGSRCKINYDPDLSIFRMSKCLPVGAHFPYDFGHIPGTLGGDGDPLDILVISQHSAFTGCLVPVQLIGVLEAEQTEGKSKKTVRNDRLIGSLRFSAEDPQASSVKNLGEQWLHEVEEFFVYYNQLEGKQFTPLGWHGPKRASMVLQQAIRPVEIPLSRSRAGRA